MAATVQPHNITPSSPINPVDSGRASDKERQKGGEQRFLCQINVIPLRLFFGCEHYAAIMVHYGEVTETEQSAVMDVGSRAGLSLLCLSSGVREALPQNGRGSTNMAPVLRGV
ncbi:hypothetical protein F2P81_012281 [Scophthalmus maximus]|uniref:Uncharacterized protein n=1 Tax=Scophthalmus maximus TaxID=52904 RepID=A0A6A4SK50_SCOMX|nr:hypothetical protein F2P81_012281 [Scophthalmus maximus]